MYVGNGSRWRMSCVMPPGMAPRARSASAAERGCMARYCSWMVMEAMITLRSGVRRRREQGHVRRMHVWRQAIDRGLTAPRHAVAGARGHAGVDEPPLVVRRVQERATGESSEMRHDAIGAPVRDTRDDEMIDANDRRDSGRQATRAPDTRAHVAHPDLVAPVADADADHSVRRAPSRSLRQQKQFVERRIPFGYVDATHVAIGAVAGAARPLDRHQMRWTSMREHGAGGIGPAGIAPHVRWLAEGRERRAEHRRGDVVGHVGDVGAQASQCTAQDGCARGPVGFGGPRGDDEAGCDDDAPGFPQRVRGTRSAARLEELFNAPPAGIESEKVVDGIVSEVWQGLCSIAGRRPVMQRLLVFVALAVVAEGCSTATRRWRPWAWAWRPRRR